MQTSKATRTLRSLLVAAIALCTVGLAPSRAQAQWGPIAVTADDIVGANGRLHELTIQTASLPTPARVRVLLPVGYDDPANATARYPMLLLLHGASGNARDWTSKTDIAATPTADGLIVVMPDGGSSGFYSDWNDGPAWETFHIRELIPWADARYRTFGDRAHRGVAGLSMGGYGALAYATRHPDLFVAAGSFSGAVDLAGLGIVEEQALKALGLADDRRWGPYASNSATWKDHNPPDMLGNLGPLPIALFTGNGVPNAGDNPAAGFLEAGVWVMNTSLHTKATTQQVPIEYHDYGAGVHSWPYWQADLHAWLPTLLRNIAHPAALPAAFSYHTAEPRFSVWGWDFSVENPAKEDVALTAVSSKALTATGHGVLSAVTPPSFVPGATYVVPGADRPTFTADADGRLHLVMTIVPAAPTTLSITAEPVATAAENAARVASAERTSALVEIPATGMTPPLPAMATLLVIALAFGIASRRSSHRAR